MKYYNQMNAMLCYATKHLVLISLFLYLWSALSLSTAPLLITSIDNVRKVNFHQLYYIQ